MELYPEQIFKSVLHLPVDRKLWVASSEGNCHDIEIHGIPQHLNLFFWFKELLTLDDWIRIDFHRFKSGFKLTRQIIATQVHWKIDDFYGLVLGYDKPILLESLDDFKLKNLLILENSWLYEVESDVAVSLLALLLCDVPNFQNHCLHWRVVVVEANCDSISLWVWNLQAVDSFRVHVDHTH